MLWALHPESLFPDRLLAVLCFGLFMLLLDGTIVNIAIPSILKSFQTGFSQVEWVMNAYLLVFAVMLITMGRLGVRIPAQFGH